MDERRIDGLARWIAGAKTSRRRVAALVVGVVALARGETVASPPVCQPENAWCTMWLRCCQGFICTMQVTSPNLGVCLPGEDVNGTGFVFAGVMPARSGSSSSRAAPTPTPTPGGTSKKQRKRERKRERREERRESKPTPTSTPRPTPAPTPSPTPGPSAPLSASIRLDCGPGLERIAVRNDGTEPFTLAGVNAVSSAVLPTLCYDVTDDPAYLLAPGKRLSLPTAGSGELWSPPVLSDRKKTSDGVIVTVEHPPTRTLHQFRGFCDGRASKPLGPIDRLECPG